MTQPQVDCLPDYPTDTEPDSFDPAALSDFTDLDWAEYTEWVCTDAANDCGLLPEDLADMGGVPW